MAKTKERTAAELRRDLEERRKRRADLQSAIDALRGLVREDLAAGRDTSRRREDLAARQLELEHLDQDLADLQEVLAAAEAQEQAAQREAGAARAGTLAATVAAEIAGLAQDLREALAAPLARLQRAEKTHQELQGLWQGLDRGGFLGGQPLVRLRYLVDALLNGVRAVEEGTR